VAPDDLALVERALAGSQAAYGDLLQAYKSPVYTLIVRMVRDPSLAEDLAQESFIKAFQHLASYDRSRKFSSWLFKIAHNTAIDHLRRKSIATVPLETESSDETSLVDTLVDAGAENPETAARSLDIANALELAVGRLKPEYREVVLLRYQAGLAYDEIADAAGLPLGTVKTHIHRARKQLCAALRELGIEPDG
jgi:RNA polymerase sigma-70 factor (ECF subfamily)